MYSAVWRDIVTILYSPLQTTITDIQAQMEAHTQRNDRLQEDNKELSGKLHTMLEQYEKREEVGTVCCRPTLLSAVCLYERWCLLQHYQTLMKKRDLEGQLYEAKLGQLQMIVEKEQEKYAEEKKMVSCRFSFTYGMLVWLFFLISMTHTAAGEADSE